MARKFQWNRLFRLKYIKTKYLKADYLYAKYISEVWHKTKANNQSPLTCITSLSSPFFAEYIGIFAETNQMPLSLDCD